MFQDAALPSGGEPYIFFDLYVMFMVFLGGFADNANR